MINQIQKQDLPGKQYKPFDILGFAVRRLPVIGIISALSLLLLSPLVWFKTTPFYQAKGSLVISPEVEMVLQGEMMPLPGKLRDFAETQTRRLSNMNVLIDALHNLTRKEWPDFLKQYESPLEAAEAIKEKLTAEHIRNTHLIFVSIEDQSGAYLDALLNAVFDSYIRSLQREQEQQSLRRLSYLEEERQKLLDELSALQDNRTSLSKELQSSFFQAKHDAAYEKLANLQELMAHAEADYIRKIANFEKTESILDERSKQSLEVLAREKVSEDQSIHFINSWTYEQLQELRSSIDGMTGQNPERILVEERMKGMEDYLDTFEQSLNETALDIFEQKQNLKLETDLIIARSEREASEKVRGGMLKSIQQAKSEYVKDSGLKAKGRDLDGAIERTRSRLTFINERLSEVKLQIRSPLQVSIEERSDRVKDLGATVPKILTMLVLLISVGAPFCFFAVIDFMDAYVNRQSEVEAALGSTPSLPLPGLGNPDSLGVKKAAKALAVKIANEQKKKNSRLFMVTGTDEQADTSFLLRVLIPELKKYKRNILLIHDDDEFQDDEISQLSLKQYPYLLDERESLVDWLNECREAYDFVIYHGKALDECDLSSYLAHYMDAAVLAVQGRSSRYRDLRDSVTRLFNAQVPAITAVLIQNERSSNRELINNSLQLLGSLAMRFSSLSTASILKLCAKPKPSQEPIQV